MSTPVTYRDHLMDRYKLLFDWLPEGGPVLDVGCGNGIFTQHLAKKASPAYGIDHHDGNLEWAREQFPHVNFVKAEGEKLPFDDEFFQSVVCTEVLEHTRDDRATLREIHRVLKPGGTLLLSTPHKGLFTFLDPDNVTNRLFKTVSKLRIPKPGGGTFYQNFDYDIHRHYTEGHLRELLGEGWQVEQVYFGGLLLYPVLYGVENMVDAFSKKRSYWQDYRALRTLRAWDFHTRFGKLSYNIALRVTKLK
jgi:ubiquinone/menaquinone biosynthesis C-methylase UbiE